MNNLKIFSSEQEVNNYFNKMHLTGIGNGVEGVAYLDNTKNCVYKQIRPDYAVYYEPSIITTSMFNLDSFIFPDELFLLRENIIGYRTRYFKGDVLCDITRREDAQIDLEKLLEAREAMIKDIKVLTDANYVLDDMYGNVLFNGEKLAAIDTLSYYQEEGIDLATNIKSLDKALDLKLYRIDPITSKWNLSFEDRVKKLIKENGTSKVLVKPMDI